MELDCFDADKMLRAYMHDYLIRKGMHATAEIFEKEGNVAPHHSAVIDSPDGFLHEWWTIFYDMYMSRQVKNQGSGPQSSSKEGPKPTDNGSSGVPPWIPPTLKSDQKPEQCQFNSGLNKKMLAQPAACLIPATANVNEHLGYLTKDVKPSFDDFIRAQNLNFLAGTSSNHLLQNAGKQAHKQDFQDSGIGIHMGRDVPRGPLDVVQRRMQPLEEPHRKNTNEALNLVRLNGCAVNNQVFNSILQAPNYQQRQVSTTQNQEVVLAQVLARSPKSQTSALPENSTKCNNHHTKIPMTESSKKDRQMMDQIRDQQPQVQSQNVEMMDQIRDQQPQVQSQNVEKSKKRKTTGSLRPGERAQDHVDAADGKPMDENVESFLSFENDHADHRVAPFSNLKRISATTNKKENKGFSFEEVGCLHSSKNKVLSSHFSSDGKVLASAGHEKKVFIWNMETFDCVATAEEHSHLITDVRFRPGSTIFATSSFDRSIKLWDAARPTKSLSQLKGHDEQIMSLDFHPRKPEILCSCDSNDVMRLWDVKRNVCLHRSKGGGSKQVRFQPLLGKFLAGASGNSIMIVDVETNKLLCHLKGHDKDVLSICWDITGKYIASVSEDRARIWSAGADGKCISELQSNGNKFQSCIFHPAYRNLLIIGGYQSLELWHPAESSKTWAIPAHKGLIAGLADSPRDELIASASHDHCVKLWK